MKKILVIASFIGMVSTHSYSVSKSKIPSNATNSSDLTIGKVEKSSPGKVRIGLKLSSYSKIQLQDQSGNTRVKFKMDDEIKRTLRARIDKPNHFVVGSYHVESIPLKWIKKTQTYAVRLSFSKRFGSYGEVEEHLGSLDVEGRLEGKDKLFVLMGAASKVIKNDKGEPLLKVLAGYGKVNVEPQNVSRLPTKERAEAPKMEAKKGKTYSSFKPRRSSNKTYVR